MKAQNLAVNLVVVVVTALATHYLWPLPAKPAPTPNVNLAQPHWPTSPPGHQPNPQPPSAITHPPSPPPTLAITPEIRDRIQKARATVLAATPALKTEEDDLNKQRQAMMKQNPPASPNERVALVGKWRDHAQKMRVAMAAADPSLEPIFADLDAKTKAWQQQAQQQQGHIAPTSGTPRTAQPPPTQAPAHPPSPTH
jgi:hypothetical protein